MDSSSHLTLLAFEQHLGSTFRAHPMQGGPQRPEGAWVDLVLVRAQQVSRTSLQDIFSVGFRGPHDQPLSQGMYYFEHNRLGGTPIFIVPYKHEGGYAYYEATFNRLLRPLRVE
jgi:hypothetical protein